jgi:alanyl-tRNA synthetase
MTIRLFYDSQYLKSFTARITKVGDSDRGVHVCLDQTAFYPTSGGQPHDTGTIDGLPVMDVWEEDGEIWHLLDSVPENVEVLGRINWTRRFDHMQQHTGQHILSKAFIEAMGVNTIGFQISSESSTIDLDLSSITLRKTQEVEEIANHMASDNHPVVIHYISKEDATSIRFRKTPQVDGTIRVIWIIGVDISACGGTHVSATGEIGLIKITSFERYKSKLRISFLCGYRAFRNYQKLYQNITQISKDLSISKDELPQAVARLKNEISLTTKALKNARKEIMEIEADRLWNNAQLISGRKYIHAYLEDRDYEDLMVLVNKLRSFPTTVILLAIREAQNIRLVCSRSTDMEGVDAGKMIQTAVNLLNGKGGGTSEMAHGGAPITDPQTVIEVLSQSIVS